MKRLFFLFPVFFSLALTAQVPTNIVLVESVDAEPEVVIEDVCWSVGAVDSSLTRFTYLDPSDSTNTQVLFYVNGSGERVTVTGGSLSLGFCGCCEGSSIVSNAVGTFVKKLSLGENYTLPLDTLMKYDHLVFLAASNASSGDTAVINFPNLLNDGTETGLGKRLFVYAYQDLADSSYNVVVTAPGGNDGTGGTNSAIRKYNCLPEQLTYSNDTILAVADSVHRLYTYTTVPGKAYNFYYRDCSEDRTLNSLYTGSGVIPDKTNATVAGSVTFDGSSIVDFNWFRWLDNAGNTHGLYSDDLGIGKLISTGLLTPTGWSSFGSLNIVSNDQSSTILGNTSDDLLMQGLKAYLSVENPDSTSTPNYYLGVDFASKEVIFTPRDSLPGGGGSTQVLTRVGTDVTLSGGGGTVSIADNDNDPANELQTVSLSNAGSFLSLTISDGNTSNVSLATDNTTITGNGTTATPFEVNTSVIATQTYVDERIGYATTNSLPNTTPFNINLQNRFSSIYELQMVSAPSPLTLTVSNPENGGVYTFHFLGVTSNDIVFPANFYYADESSIGTLSLTESDFLTCYYSGANFYCK